MSENENGTPPSSDTNEAATTIGLPTPAKSSEESDSHGVTEASEEQALVIEPKSGPAAAEVAPAEAEVNPAEAAASSIESDAVQAGPDQAEDDDEVHRSLMWPVDPDHKNAIGVLSETLDGVKVIEEAPRKRPSRALNLMLLVICIGISVAGAQQLADERQHSEVTPLHVLARGIEHNPGMAAVFKSAGAPVGELADPIDVAGD